MRFRILAIVNVGVLEKKNLACLSVPKAMVNPYYREMEMSIWRFLIFLQEGTRLVDFLSPPFLPSLRRYSSEK